MNLLTAVIPLLWLIVPSNVSAQDTPKPATALQVKNAIDWSKVPLLEGATKKQTLFNHLNYQAPGTFSQAADFYAKQLPALGYNLDSSFPAHDQKDYLSAMYIKDGMWLSLSGYRSAPADPMTITLMINGNVDVSLFPKVADAQIKHAQKNSVYYFSKQPPEDVASFYRKFMKAQGWTEKVEDMAAEWAKEGRHVLSFQQNAMECIVVAAKKDGGVEVTCSALVRHNLSASDVAGTLGGSGLAKPATLAQAGKVLDIKSLPRMKNATAVRNQKEIFALIIGTSYQVPDSVDDATKFYRNLLKEKGCTELSPMLETDQLAMLYFEKEDFLFGLTAQRDKKEGTTSVTLMNHGNVDLRKLPAPPGAEIESFRSEHMNLETTLSLDAAHAFYRKELGKLGWKDANPESKVIMKFTQNGVTLDIEIQSNIYKKTAVQLRVGMK